MEQRSSSETWTAVDRYIEERLIDADPALERARRAAEEAGLPAIAVTPAQGKLMHLLARSLGATRILEVGTLGGYSAIWLARALPSGGQLVTLELEPAYAAVAAASIEGAGLDERVDLRIGPAARTLAAMVTSGEEPFDLVFIDADKRSTPEYFARALELTRPGSVIVVDNVVRDGRLISPDSGDPDIEGNRTFHERLASERRVSATTIQTVGAKGYDGFTLALVNAGG